MAASASDYFKKTGNSTATTLSAPGHTIGGTSITVGSTANWPTTTGVTFAIDVVTLVGTEEVQTAGTYTLWHGTVSGTTISNMTLATESPNSDQNYAAGSLTRVYLPVSAALHNNMAKGIAVEHNQDGTHAAVTATSVTATATVQGATVVSTGDVQLRSTSLETIASEQEFDFVASGCVWSGDSYGSTRAASMTAGVVYIGGKRVSVALVTARSFTASKDTYIDVDNTGTLTYTEVTNNAASPSLAANSIRLGIIVSGANIANVGSVNQGQADKVLPIASSIAYTKTDSLGNIICPRDPNRRVLGYRQIIASTAALANNAAVTGLSVPVIVPTGRSVKLTAFCEAINGSTASAQYGLAIWDGTIGTIVVAVGYATAHANNAQIIGSASSIVTPSSTSKTYNVGMYTNSGTGTVIAATGQPAYVLVELV